MKYGYRDGYSLPGLDPDELGAILEGIAAQHGGVIATKVVKEAARDKKHRLHNYIFDMSVNDAAEEHYDQRAMYITRSIYLVIPDRPEIQAPAVINIVGGPKDDGIGQRVLDRGYRMLDEVMSDPRMREEALRRVWESILRLKQLYQHLTEFSEIWDAVAKVESKRQPARKVAGKRG